MLESICKSFMTGPWRGWFDGTSVDESRILDKSANLR
jgi:hypothetical protein